MLCVKEWIDDEEVDRTHGIAFEGLSRRYFRMSVCWEEWNPKLVEDI